LLGLEAMISRPDFVFGASLILLLISFFEGKKIGGKWIFAILPVFFTLSSVVLLYLITLPFEQQIFIFISSLMYYLSLFGAFRLGVYDGDKTARAMNMAAASATIFFMFSGAYGIYLNFLIPVYYLMLTYLITTLLISYQYFAIIKKESQATIWIYSFLLALIMVELIWTMNFWPFGYLTTGVIALTLYYILWDLVQSHFLNLLSRKRVVANMVVFSILITLVLISSKWFPII